MNLAVAPTPYVIGPRALLRVVDDAEPDDSLDVEALGSRIVGMAGRLAASTCRWLLLVADFDAREGFTKFGLWSTARWLSHYCGLSRRTALEHLRVARVLAARPALAATMSKGRLSYSQVRAISRLHETASNALFEELISIAEHSTVGQLEEVVRGLRTVDDNDSDDVVPDREAISRRWGSDSRLHLNARLDPENGALVQSAIETIAARENLTHAQALVRIAEIALATTNADMPAPKLRGDELAAVVIHLDADAVTEPEGLSEPEAESAPRSAERGRNRERSERPFARVAHGAGLPRRVVERLLCVGRIRTAVLDKGGSPLDVGRSHRVATPKQIRALLVRQGGRCGHPGCRSRANLEAHHVRHWLYGGGTDMANLVLLCEAHHHAHHDGEFTISPAGKNRFRFRRADGAELPDTVDPTTVMTSNSPIVNEYAHLKPDASRSRWDGTRLDLDYAMTVLAPGLERTA